MKQQTLETVCSRGCVENKFQTQHSQNWVKTSFIQIRALFRGHLFVKNRFPIEVDIPYKLIHGLHQLSVYFDIMECFWSLEREIERK